MSRKRRAPQLKTYVRDDLDSSPSFLNCVSVTKDRYRSTSSRVRIAPLSPEKTKKARLTGDEDISMEDSDWGGTSLELGNIELGIAGVDEDVAEENDSELKESVKRSLASDFPMTEWVKNASAFLDEIIRLEGRRSTPLRCFRCKQSDTDLYRCRDCCEKRLSCSECLVFDHRRRPFDRVEKWNGKFFERVTLKSLGLFIQLGHPPGEACKMHDRAPSGFVIVDINSIQEVDVRYCICQPDVGKDWQQLLRYELYPATVMGPRTAFTFQTLTLFHTMTHLGKVTLYDFYRTLEARTDGVGLGGVKDRYEAFVRAARQWQYLKMLKRGGVANISTSARDLSNIRRGSLALRCLACPRPDVNLPDNWQQIASDKSYLYFKFIGVDACFRLKRRHISSEEKDPGLATGLAYYVPQEQYQKFVAKLTEQKETSTCTGLQAVSQANTKFSKSYATTGVLLCLCIRHEMVEPNGTVDLNKGEKFGHADYAISASQSLDDPRLKRILSYDIACQYYVKFFGRMAWIPEPLKMVVIEELWRFVVPKLHIHGHERKCQENFSLHFEPGSGQSDGEGLERHWAGDGGIATSTREMGPGHRRDTMDDQFSSWNHRKRIGLGKQLKKRRREALCQQKVHTELYEQFTASQTPEVIKDWSAIVLNWEQGVSKRNPYSLPRSGTTEQDVRLHYAQKEAEALRKGIVAVHDVSASAFMYIGLEIEEQQRWLVMYIKQHTTSTSLQKTDLLERRAKVDRLIYRFRQIQQVYMPAVSELLEQSRGGEQVEVEAEGLLLPSELPEAMRKDPALEKWVKMEMEYRRGQCQSSLDGIRTRLFLRSRLLTDRSMNKRHQSGAKEARISLGNNDDKMEELKAKYRAAYDALLVLHGGILPTEEQKFRRLQDSDVRALDEEDTHAVRNVRKALGAERMRRLTDSLIKAGESRQVLSWIWVDWDVSGDPSGVKEVIRVQWSKAWARKRRWDEELHLVEEEMRRTVVTLQYEATEWRTRVLQGGDSALDEGMNAYAERQAVWREQLAASFAESWRAPVKPLRASRSRPYIGSDDEGAGEGIYGNSVDPEEVVEDDLGQ
ncbi:hypothetical protein VNI00_018627 [Paramarasmius palmivorus]|uniref:CxC2-like cysteine cluster KDZ transposase-associated domain-containing protein n=1 Tax=Paramarasmius palmivorus TaxID=297713 RepID=A0AAW0AWY8_9AGAR